MPKWPVHARVDGPIVMIGFGSIGKGTLPLIERHFSYDKKRFVVIDPEDKDRKLLDSRGIRFIHQAVTKDNYRHLLTPLLTAGGGQGFCVNVSVDTSSLDIMVAGQQQCFLAKHEHWCRTEKMHADHGRARAHRASTIGKGRNRDLSVAHVKRCSFQSLDGFYLRAGCAR